MTLRTKLAVALGVLAAVATLTVGILGFRATRHALYDEIDESLVEASGELRLALRRVPADVNLSSLAASLDRGERPPGDDGRRDRQGRRSRLDQVVVQIATVDGTLVWESEQDVLPPPGDRRRSAKAETPAIDGPRTDSSGSGEVRLLSQRLANGLEVTAGRSLAEPARVLSALRRRTAMVGLLVGVAAAALGWIIARQMTRRLTALTTTAEDVARTGRLDVAVPVRGSDEAGRLSAAFSGMLAALAQSRDSQTRLVQDAGHELRTPLTSLRTNIATLRRHDRLDDTTRHAILDDLDSEARELTDLVNELVELATDHRADEPVAPVDLAAIVGRVVDRARRRSSRGVVVSAPAPDAEMIDGQVGALERAISNLVDNALKFSDPPTIVEVTIVGGRVEVLDRGTGIPDAELSKIFDRFHRSVEARSRPGSGLGLAIVREIAERHGGRVHAANRPGGGAIVGFELPLPGTTAAAVAGSIPTSGAARARHDETR